MKHRQLVLHIFMKWTIELSDLKYTILNIKLYTFNKNISINAISHKTQLTASDQLKPSKLSYLIILSSFIDLTKAVVGVFL